MFAPPKMKTALQWDVHGRVQLRSRRSAHCRSEPALRILFWGKDAAATPGCFISARGNSTCHSRGGGGERTQISINNGSVPSGAPGEAESEPARAATPGTPVTLHPLIKEPVFLRRGYNVSCVQPVHYAPLLSSSCCRRVTHGCLSTTLQFLLLNHINAKVWRETKVKFSSKLSPCTKYKFLTFILRFVRLKMIRFFYFSS